MGMKFIHKFYFSKAKMSPSYKGLYNGEIMGFLTKDTDKIEGLMVQTKKVKMT
jgi:hypothetical protein